jgi:hypothetical protein
MRNNEEEPDGTLDLQEVFARWNDVGPDPE